MALIEVDAEEFYKMKADVERLVKDYSILLDIKDLTTELKVLVSEIKSDRNENKTEMSKLGDSITKLSLDNQRNECNYETAKQLYAENNLNFDKLEARVTILESKGKFDIVDSNLNNAKERLNTKSFLSWWLPLMALLIVLFEKIWGIIPKK